MSLSDYDNLGMPKFGGWVFSGFDTRMRDLIVADQKHHDGISQAVQRELVLPLQLYIKHYHPVSVPANGDYELGQIEDMNTLIQDSLWQAVPVSQLMTVTPINRSSWALNQKQAIKLAEDQFKDLANNIISTCR
jgi:hypothetical protein